MPPPIKFPNGSPGGGPLNLSPKQRHLLLARHGMEMGWLLLTRSEMIAMKQAMESAKNENDRLNGEIAKLIAERVTVGELGAIKAVASHAADLLKDEATCLENGHTVNGKWEGSYDKIAKTLYDDFTETAKKLIEFSSPQPQTK